MSQPHSHSLKPDGHKAKTPVQMARSAAWQICIEELKAWRVRRAARLLLTIVITFVPGALAGMILKKIFGPYAGLATKKGIARDSRLSQPQKIGSRNYF